MGASVYTFYTLLASRAAADSEVGVVLIAATPGTYSTRYYLQYYLQQQLDNSCR